MCMRVIYYCLTEKTLNFFKKKRKFKKKKSINFINVFKDISKPYNNIKEFKRKIRNKNSK